MRLSILDFIRTTQENKEKTIHIIVMNPYDVSVVTLDPGFNQNISYNNH